jgi:hypothetical protein
MGESAQLNFAPKKFGRNLVDLGEFFPNQQIFGWDNGRISPKSKKNRPQILGRILTARIRPFMGEQELLCRVDRFQHFCELVFWMVWKTGKATIRSIRTTFVLRFISEVFFRCKWLEHECLKIHQKMTFCSVFRKKI